MIAPNADPRTGIAASSAVTHDNHTSRLRVVFLFTAMTQQTPVAPHEHFVSEIIVSGEYYEDHEAPRGESAK